MVVRMVGFVAVFCVALLQLNASAVAQSRNPKRVDLNDEPSIAYQAPEEFPPSRWGEFQKQAEELWTTHPDHPYAARAMFDWLLVAQSRQSPPADIERVQFELLIQHPSSIYSRHVVAGTNPQELRKRLSSRFEERQELNDQFLTQFGRLVLLGFSVHGPGWITPDEFGIQSLLSARVAKLSGLTGLLESKFAEAPAETKKILEAGLDPTASAADRYVRLGEFGKVASARMIQRVLWLQLSEEEQQQPRVQVALAEQFLREGRLDLVLPITQRLRKLEPNNSRWLLWTGCCLVATDRDAEGRRCLKQVVQLDPGTDAGKVAARLLPVLDVLPQSEADCLTVLDELTNRVIQTSPQVLTLESTFEAKDGEPVRIQIQFEGPRFRMVCWKGKHPRVGFQNGPESCQFFTTDEAATLELMGRQYQPALVFQLTDKAVGLGFHLNANLVSAPPDLTAVIRSFLESTCFANGGWQNLMRRRRSVGTFAAPVEVTDGGRTLRWLNVDLLQTKITDTSCHLSENGDIKELELYETRVKGVRWGKLGEVDLPKLAWPDYPIRRLSSEDFTGMMRLMSLMTQIYSFDDPPLTAQKDRPSSKR